MKERSNDRFQCNENGLKIHVSFVVPADVQSGPKVKSELGYFHFDFTYYQSQIKDLCFLEGSIHLHVVILLG